jgi:hypothetical protein
MTDLVERLRAYHSKLMTEAAARIEALEADLAQWVRQAEDNSGGWQRACLRIEALEAALREIMTYTDDEYFEINFIARTALAPEQDK